MTSKPMTPTMHNYEDYRWLRGFNYIPSWGATIEQAWWQYDAKLCRKEVALATQTHANCLRLWIEFSAWMADPEGVRRNFLDAIAAIDEAGMKVMPCIFNRWHDSRFDYGGTYDEQLVRNLESRMDYVRHIVEPLIDDPRILLWDLCNEPAATNLDDPKAAREMHWLSRVADTVRRAGVQQPITIGTWQLGASMEIYASLSDVLCCHPYGHTPAQQDEMIEVCASVQRRYAKPMLCNEAIPGCLDDGKRAECARWTIRKMEDAGFGWMGWGMHEGLAISTRRDRYDANGIDGNGFHAWFNADGSLRSGLEFLREPPRYAAPWQNVVTR